MIGSFKGCLALFVAAGLWSATALCAGPDPSSWSYTGNTGPAKWGKMAKEFAVCGTGELVFTSLTKEALPIIRYRTRDLTRLLPPTSRSMRRMGKITGRSDDMLIIRGVNVFPTQVEELILKDRALEPHYQLEITRPGSLDELAVIVERSPGAGAADGEAAGKRLAHNIKSMIGVTADVRIVAPGGIERSLGKARRVIDKRPKG